MYSEFLDEYAIVWRRLHRAEPTPVLASELGESESHTARILHNAVSLVAALWAPQYLRSLTADEVWNLHTPETVRRVFNDVPTVILSSDNSEVVGSGSGVRYIERETASTKIKHLNTFKFGTVTCCDGWIADVSPFFGGAAPEKTSAEYCINKCPFVRQLCESERQRDGSSTPLHERVVHLVLDRGYTTKTMAEIMPSWVHCHIAARLCKRTQFSTEQQVAAKVINNTTFSSPHFMNNTSNTNTFCRYCQKFACQSSGPTTGSSSTRTFSQNCTTTTHLRWTCS